MSDESFVREFRPLDDLGCEEGEEDEHGRPASRCERPPPPPPPVACSVQAMIAFAPYIHVGSECEGLESSD